MNEENNISENKNDPTPVPVPAPVVAKPRRRIMSGGVAAMLGLTLAVGAIGGAAGGVAAANLSDTVSPTVITAQQASNSQIALNLASAVYSEVGPSVVQINVTGQTFRGLSRGNGSGVVIDDQGHILTNAHVVENATSVNVRFKSGETLTATVVGTDRNNDLAVIKVDLPSGVPAAKLGNSDEVQVGETAIAIGSPFGLAQTVTQGIISAVNREWRSGSGSYQGLIQTDAPINPGNSGGPLVNANGEVIGINSMIESPVEGSVGIGFAIPINRAKELLPQLKAGAQLQRAWLGISGMDSAEAALEGQTVPVNYGVVVMSVVAGSPASTAGLRGADAGNADVIISLNRQRINGMADLIARLRAFQPGTTITLTVVRGGRQVDVPVTLGTWPQS